MENTQKKNRPVAGWISVGLGAALVIMLIVEFAMGLEHDAGDYFAIGTFVAMLLGVGVPLLYKNIRGFGWAMAAIFCAGRGINRLLFPETQDELAVGIASCAFLVILAVLFAWLCVRANKKYRKTNEQ